MSLLPGTRFGVYEIVAPLGAGGMGEVFRARDTDLDRDVALKILPASFAGDADRLMRFEREAKTLATLNHPHIAQIYGIADRSGTRALVMELVDGEDLSARLQRGRIELDDSVSIARQVADALEAAHERGIVHRDLKPANIKMRADGTVKVLDFGLAKAVAAEGQDEASVSALGQSPTITSPAMTQAGIVLGTAAYMSPEQAKGKPVDRRADVWAFGCVLFEMLTGLRAFPGSDVAETLAAVIRGEPEWNSLPAGCPASIQRLLRRCLQKDPARRLRHIGDARIELDEVEVSVPIRRSASMRSAAVAWGVAALAIVGAVLAIGWPRANPETASAAVYLTIPLTDDFRFRPAVGGGAVAVSPDSRTIVYTSGNDAGDLVMRRLDSPELIRLAARGRGPFFSPDSKWLGYFDEGALKKISLNGGSPITVCKTNAIHGAWGDDGTIILAGRNFHLARVPESGGEPSELLAADGEIQETAQPIMLPGSQTLLFRKIENGQSKIRALSLVDHTITDVVLGSNPQLADDNLLVYVSENTLWAAAFDSRTARLTSAPLSVQSPIRMPANGALYAASNTGALAFLAAATSTTSLTWIDRAGKMQQAIDAAGFYAEPQLSPDGREVVVSVARGDNATVVDLFVIDLERETARRLTTDTGRRPRWSAPGLVAYQDGRQHISIRRADGTGDTRHIERAGAQFPDDWAPDGKTLIFNEGGLARDLWATTVDGEAVRLLPPSSFSERGGRVSPTGRLIAFVSNESGRDEVYVQPFPGPGAKMVVSATGGKQPVWSRDGRELFYRVDDTMMAATIDETAMRVGASVALFEFKRSLFGDDRNRVEYDVARDGRFIAAKANVENRPQEISVILNWATEFRRDILKQ